MDAPESADDSNTAPSKTRWLTHPLAVMSIMILVPILLLWAFLVYRQQELAVQLENLRQQGMPTNGEELNAYYVIPAGVTDSTSAWMDALQAADLASKSKAARALPIIGLGEPSSIPRRGAEWAQLDEARTFVEAHHSVRKLIHDAAALEGQARFPADFSAGTSTLLPHLEQSRSAARFLTLDANVANHDGDFARMKADVRAMLELVRALQDEPVVISQLIRYAVFSQTSGQADSFLSDSDWSDAELQALQKQVQSLDFRKDFNRALIGEHALIQTSLEDISVLPFRIYLKRYLLDYYGKIIHQMSGTWQADVDRLNRLDQEFQSMAINRFPPLAAYVRHYVGPLSSQLFTASLRARARQRCLNLAIAAQRFRLAHGHFPEAFSEIDPEWVGPAEMRNELLTDPFDLAPLRLKHEADRIIIYSTAEDLKDDGGDCLNTSSTRTKDVGSLLWKGPPVSP